MPDFLPVVAGLAVPSILDIAGAPTDGAPPDGAFAELLEGGQPAPSAAPKADQSVNLSASVSPHLEFCQLASIFGASPSKPSNGTVSAETASVIALSSGTAPNTLDEVKQTTAQTDDDVVAGKANDGLTAAPEINVTFAQAQAAPVPVPSVASAPSMPEVSAFDAPNEARPTMLRSVAITTPITDAAERQQTNGSLPVEAKSKAAAASPALADPKPPPHSQVAVAAGDSRASELTRSIQVIEPAKVAGEAPVNNDDPATSSLALEVPIRTEPFAKRSTTPQHSPNASTSQLASTRAPQDQTNGSSSRTGKPPGEHHASNAERGTLSAVLTAPDQVAFDPPASRSGSQAIQALHALSEIATPSASAVGIIHAAAPLAAPFSADPATAAAPSVPITGLAVEIAARAREGDRRFEIRIDPPELGRIDVRLDFGRDGQVTSRLVVERAETLDLLRRDVATLERALQSAGLQTNDGAMQFSLRDQAAGRWAGFEATARPSLLIVPDADVTVHEAVRRGYGALRGLGAGVDISV